MTRITKAVSLVLLWGALFVTGVGAQTVNAASCLPTAVQAAINTATEGQTVTIPSCPGGVSWTSGVTISGKGIKVQGAGSGRIVAYDNGVANVTVGTGTKTWTIAGFSPNFSSSVFVPGHTMTASATGFDANSMTGTVTSYSAGTLTMNITSITGSGSFHRWFFSTPASTVFINNSGSTLFSVNEDTVFHTDLSGFKIQAGTGGGNGVDFNLATGGKAIVLHDCWIQQGNGDSVHSFTNRGVVANCSFDSPTFSETPLAFHWTGGPTTSWTTVSNFGTNDTTGESNFYVESNDFEAYLNATDLDDNSRVVFRYNLLNNAGFGTHGADTSNTGVRYFEFYNNTGIFNGYNDSSTFNMNWWMFIRGGTFLVHHNTLPDLVSGFYGTKSTINMTVYNLQQQAGPNPCWGAGGTPGQYYHAPRQVGFGRVTGTGTANYPPDGVNNSSNDSVTYVGDSEPAYIWANDTQPLHNVDLSDSAGSGHGSCTSSDQSSNYIQLNRDYFNGATAKPGYTPYTYPHPLTQTGLPASPSNLAAIPH